MPAHLSQYRLHILHISDLHERGPRESEPWRGRRVLGVASEDNIAELLQDVPIDLVCFTGDAANRGLGDEYEHTTDFFLSVMERLHLPLERLFVIPDRPGHFRPGLPPGAAPVTAEVARASSPATVASGRRK